MSWLDTKVLGRLDFEVSMDQTTMLVCTVGQSEEEEEFWVCEPGKKPEMDGEDDDDNDEPSHGPVKMEGRAPVWVDPQEEWRQMLHECWRYMRDEAWTPESVDWNTVLRNHAACLPRVATPGEQRTGARQSHGGCGVETSHCSGSQDSGSERLA